MKVIPIENEPLKKFDEHGIKTFSSLLTFDIKLKCGKAHVSFISGVLIKRIVASIKPPNDTRGKDDEAELSANALKAFNTSITHFLKQKTGYFDEINKNKKKIKYIL